MTVETTGTTPAGEDPAGPQHVAPHSVDLPRPREDAEGAQDAQTVQPRPEPLASVPGADYRRSLPWRVVNGLATAVDRRIGWDRLPVPLGLATLVGIRNVLRQRNLHDPQTVVPVVGPPPVEPPRPEHRTQRTSDGSYNDLENPRGGMAGTRFGRNVPMDEVRPATDADLLTPNPRVVSRRLLTRSAFQPATSVNVLAAA